VCTAVHSNGRGMLAQAVQRVVPMEVLPNGTLVLGYVGNDDTFAKAVDGARADVVAAVQGALEGITGITLRLQRSAAEQPAARPTKRLTAAVVQQQRMEQLQASDPLLDAAVRVLDLELLD